MFGSHRILPRFALAILAVALFVAGLALPSLGISLPRAVQAQRGPLLAVEPAAGSREVWLGAPIAMSFDRAVDAASVEAALTVEPAAPGTFVWQADQKARAELRPREPLAPKTAYKVTLGTGARDAQGRPLLTEPFVWTFTTSDWSGNVTFGWGVPVQLLAPSGQHGMGVYPPYPRMTVDVAAYALDVPGFATRYAAAMPLEGEPKKIDFKGLPEVARWTAAVDNSQQMSGLRLPKSVPAGLYVIDVRHPRSGDAQVLLIYSDHTVVAKQGRNDLVAWTTGVLDGKPDAGATVRLVDARGQTTADMPADSDGLARFAKAGSPAFAVATIGAQVTLVGLDQAWRSGEGYWRWWGGWWGGEAPSHTGHVHTDRPIYRPGHTVHYKATIRRFGDDGLEVIAPTARISVTVRDSRSNVIVRAAPTADDFGSVAGDIVLGDEVAMGDWSIEVRTGDQAFYGYFKVEDYVKPDFEVKLATDRPYYVRDERAQVTVRADYYFGQPAAGADATLRVYRGYYYRGSGLQPVAVVSGTLGADGSWATSVPLPGNETYTEQVTLEAEVMDATRRPVVSSIMVPVHPAAFTLELTTDRYGVEVGRPAVYTVRTMGHDGTPAAGRKVAVEVRQWDREGYKTIRTTSATTGADGTASVTFADLKEGWFSVVAQAADDAGRRIETQSYAWLYSVAYPWYWWGGLELETDKQAYAAGDTMRLLVKSPVTTTALVTIERDDVHDEIVVPVTGGTTVELPIKPEYAPNVWVKVQLWQPSTNPWEGHEGQLLTATKLVRVPADDRRLSVDVVPGAPTAGPGEDMAFTIRVRDAAGRPVDAQVSLALVDKAVLALTPDRSGDIFDAFWGEWQNAVKTFDSMQVGQTYRGREDAAGPPTANPAPGGRGDPTKDRSQDTVPPAPRREFKDTAYWNATLATGPDGDVTVTVKLPDNLTTWKAIARAIAKTSQAGQGSGEIVVTQPIIAEPALPRFAVQGDQFLLDVLGRNYVGGTQAGRMTLDTPNLVQLDPGERSLDLPFNTTKVGRWSVVASKVGTDMVNAQLTTPAGQDAVELPFEVQAFTVPERFVLAGSTTTSVDEKVEVPFNAVPDASKVEIRVTPGMAVGVLDGVEDLIGYPYGCVEQTMSKVLPNAVVGRLVKATGIEAPEITDKLPAYMAVGLQKLYGFQNTDGSWGWWNGDGNLYTTAYVLHGLTLTREAGFEVDPGVLDRGFAWLTTAMGQEKDARMQAYALYVLAAAGRGDVDAARRLLERRSELDPFGLGAVALALHLTGQHEPAERALNALAAHAKTSPTTAWWPLETPDGWRWDDYHWRSMASTEKSTAMALLALATIRPADPLAPKAARWLMEHRWGRGWPTTQATAFAILGLTDYIVASGELSSDYSWSVKLDGRPVGSGKVDRANILTAIPPVVLTGPSLSPGPHVLSFQKQGTGTLFYTVLGQMAVYYPAFEPTQAEGLGIGIKREYTPIAGRSDSEGWHVGDVVNVRLTVDVAEDVQYVLVEDKLPAGLEGLIESLDTETNKVPGGSDPVPGRPGRMPIWRWWGYERKDVRADTVTFFASYLPAGTHMFEYAARAITPGTFAARPAEAYPMYRPDVWGRSASNQVAIDAGRVAARPRLAGDFDRDCRLTDFDASLVASSWADGKGRDVTGDGRVSAADIAAAAGRAGKVCGDSVPPLPAPAGDMALTLRVPAAVQFGQPFDLEVVAEGSGNIGAFEVTVALPAGAFEVLGATNGERVPGAVVLAPQIDKAAGTVRFGGWAARGADGRGAAVLARLTLRPLRTADSKAEIRHAEVVTDAGGVYRVTVDGVVIGPQPWEPVARLFAPAVWKGYEVR